MRYEDVTPAMREFLGNWEGFRRLGFKADDIYVMVARSFMAGGRDAAFCVLKSGGREFTIECGTVEDAETFLAEYKKVTSSIKEMSLDVLDRIWEESLACKASLQFVTGIQAKGIEIPGNKDMVN